MFELGVSWQGKKILVHDVCIPGCLVPIQVEYTVKGVEVKSSVSSVTTLWKSNNI